MHVVRDPLRSSDLPRGGVATIGNFDGVHLGHRRILETVVARAREAGKPSIAITFEPHPLAVLRPDHAPPRLQTLRQKEEAIEALGIEWLLVIPFTRDFSLTEPEDFARSFLAERLGVSEIFLGAHFAFGRGKRGDLELLRRLSGPNAGFAAEGVEEVLHEGEPISSTRIREALARGDVALARGAPRARLRDRRNRGAGRPRRAEDRIPDDQPRSRERALPGGRRLRHAHRDPLVRPALRLRDEHRPAPDGLRGLRDDDRDLRARLQRRTSTASASASSSSTGCARSASSRPSMALTEQIGRDIEATRAYLAGRPAEQPPG